ncbi:MAG TPA: AraC family transcriptional regulator ligand-binding domain-containing protein [Solimonas sp.]|nr:AraC family transcriptional regulator ligand-binding domain-containing protein [Solimonas sp.]
MRDSGQMLQIMHRGMVAAGLDVNALYERLGYDAEKLPLRELRTPHQMQAFFWTTLEAFTGDAEIGLHLCPHLPPYRGEVLEYLLFSSPTVGEGVRRALKYQRLLSDALDIRVEPAGPSVRLVVVGTAVDAPQSRHTDICVAYELAQMARNLTEGKFGPQRLRLRWTQRAAREEYERIFGCPVDFEAPQTELWFDSGLIDYRSPHGDPDLLKLHEEVAERRLSAIKRDDLIDRIRVLFSQKLELEQLELDDVAHELGMSPRRLRFELTRAGTSFSQLLADFRFALARKLLATTEEPIENIVYLTGFSEPSTFYRAFKRWSGMTPVQYRERKRKPADR